ncbi:hypothetical protein D3C80_1701380 [compost metagenome]
MQNFKAQVEGGCMNDRHELPADPVPLMLWFDKYASYRLPLQTGGGDDTLIDRCHIHPALRHQSMDRLW